MNDECDQNRESPLEGGEALELWRQGPASWNNFIIRHPSLFISFADIDFSSERKSGGEISFSGYDFGDGHVDFSSATFGKGDVNFSEAKFRNGNLYFHGTVFGDGVVSFSSATLDNCNLVLAYTRFGDGKLYFSDLSLDEGKLIIEMCSFAKTDIFFSHCKLKSLSFSPDNCGSGHIEAEGLSINSRATFNLYSRAGAIKSLNLNSASFDGPLILSGDLGTIPDLRATRYSHQVDLSSLNVKLQRRWQEISWPPKLSFVAKDSQDAARLRRLKEIAETNKDHQAALRFSADENRARRWIETSWFGSVLDMTFSVCSNYGQSILRPITALVLLAAASIGLYKKLATTDTEWWTGHGWGHSFLLSVGNSLPFLPQSRGIRDDAIKVLYSNDPSLLVDAVMIGQGALSFIFLFLIGLGLRNRFRL